MLRLHDHLAPEVRDKYAEEYARKLAPSYRVPKRSHKLAHVPPLSLLDARGVRVAAGRYRGQKASWLFPAWQWKPDDAKAFAAYIVTNAGKFGGRTAAAQLATLVALTPKHNAMIAEAEALGCYEVSE